MKERELEDRLIDRLRDFILELGCGFCFIGRQHRVTLGRNEYFIDLLFSHRFLKTLVAVELKTGKFEPEYASEVNFHLNLPNEKERATADAPSIGSIVCAEKDGSPFCSDSPSPSSGLCGITINRRLAFVASAPQCGFSSTVHGNNIVMQAQRDKFCSVVETALEVWNWPPQSLPCNAASTGATDSGQAFLSPDTRCRALCSWLGGAAHR